MTQRQQMTGGRALAAAVSFALGLAILGTVTAAGAGAARAASDQERAEELAREGIERLMQALEALVESIPHYEMPEINEDGDIIIRRKRRGSPDEEPDSDLESKKI